MTDKVTKDQIAQWKQDFEAVFKIVVEDKTCYLHSPNRKALSAASVIGAQNPMAFNEYILDKCWLAGDEEIKTKDSYFLAASGQLAEILNFKEATLEKL